jgi:membrane protein implicated in regulation of membrane protease activity
MKGRKWSKRVLLRYILLQVPGLAVLVGVILLVREWMVFPDLYAWVAVGVWMAKDVVLFRYVWQAYDWDHPKHSSPMFGKRGQVKEKLAPSGYVQIGGGALAGGSDKVLVKHRGGQLDQGRSNARSHTACSP